MHTTTSGTSLEQTWVITVGSANIFAGKILITTDTIFNEYNILIGYKVVYGNNLYQDVWYSELDDEVYSDTVVGMMNYTKHQAEDDV